MSTIGEMASWFNVTEEEREELFSRLGVKSSKPEDIKDDVLEKVLNHLIKIERDKEEAINAKQGIGVRVVGKGNEPSTSQRDDVNKLKDLEVQLDDDESTVEDVKSSEECVRGSGDGIRIKFQPCRDDLTVRHALAANRLKSLRRTKAQFEEQNINLGKGSFQEGSELQRKVLQSIVKEEPNLEQNKKDAPEHPNKKRHRTVEEEEEELLSSLGVKSAKPEDIEHGVLEEALNHVIKVERAREEVNSATQGSEVDGVGKNNEPSSTSQTDIINKLRAVKVELDAVASTVDDVKRVSRTEECARGSGDGIQINFQPCRNDLDLRHALTTDRLKSLKKTKAQLEKQIANMRKGSSAEGSKFKKVFQSLAKKVPNLKRRQKDAPMNLKKKRHKTVSFNDDGGDFDAVLDAASVGFVETEKEKLVRKGILTPFHKLKGFERRIQEPGPSHTAEGSNDLGTERNSKTKPSDQDSLKENDAQSHTQGAKTPTKTQSQDRKAGRPKDSNRKSTKGASQVEETEDAESSSIEEGHQEEIEEDETSFVTLEGGLKIPVSVFSKLFDYQKVGVKWLWELHCQRVGGIIGDEMGLGKTIQMLSFLGALHFSKMYRPSIVVCPVTLLQQWKREANKWYPSFHVEILHDSARNSLEKDTEMRFSSRSNKKWDSLINRVLRNESGLLITTYDQLRILGEKLLDIDWGYAVLDEGHRIRNPNAEVTLVCKQLQTVHRIIMTGAPIQNRLSELWSLFDFVIPGKLGVLPVFEAEFAVPICLGGFANASPLQVATAYRCAVILRDLIMPYLLRRMKADVNTQLPKKTEHVLFCSLTSEQRSLYRAFLASPEVEQLLRGDGRNSHNGSSGMHKVCIDPDLLDEEDDDQNPDHGNSNRSGRMHEQSHRGPYFPETRPSLNRPFPTSPEEEELLNRERSTLYGNDLMHQTCNQKPEPSGRMNEQGHRILHSGQTQHFLSRAFLASSNMEQGDKSLLCGIDVMRKICNHPDLLKREHAAQNPDYGNPERSGKMKVVGQVLKMWKEQGHRVLLFAQTRQMLDILEKFLIADGYTYRRMDGLTPSRRRMGLMDEFNNSADVFVFILTTKVGGLGTNLTGADRVIIFDPDWNPSIDMQARERAWRIGQKKDVTVYRLVTRGTIEEKVYHRQIYKQFLTNKVLKNPQQRRFFKRRDMRDLFTLNDDTENGSTETSNLFSQLSEDINVVAAHGSNKQDRQESATVSGNFSETGTSEKEEEEKADDSSGELDDETSILRNLFDAQGIHSAVDHDIIMNAHREEKDKLEEQASKVAQRAAEALLQSRIIRSQESVAVPTWTGKSGAAGAPSPSKLGPTVNLGGVEPEVLVCQIRTFLQQRGGTSDSASITHHFKGLIPSKDLYMFKSLLKQVAILQKTGHGSSWILKPEYELH